MSAPRGVCSPNQQQPSTPRVTVGPHGSKIAGTGNDFGPQLRFFDAGFAAKQQTTMPPSVELRPGQDVKVAEKNFWIQELLSRGSFGDVWVAHRLRNSGNSSNVVVKGTTGVVIKEIFCQHRAGLAAAEFEGEILRLCGPFGSAGYAQEDEGVEARVPALLAQDTTQVENYRWRVRLAMARVPGEPLDDYLDRKRKDIVAKHKPGDLCRQFKESLEFAETLLLQLSAAMQNVSQHVFHRDIHARNMLVEEMPNRSLKFGLVDFGLAVDARKWRSGKWRDYGAAGDCRFWPPSAWLYFAEGENEVLDSRPGLRKEYEERLDTHAVALVVLEALAKLSPPKVYDDISLPRKVSTVLVKVLKVGAAWEEYWSHSSRFWKVVFGAFANGEDLMELKTACAEVSVHSVIQEDLVTMRQSVLEARDACNSASCQVEAASADAAAGGAALAEATEADSDIDEVFECIIDVGQFLFDVIADLISCGDQQTHEAPSWNEVVDRKRRLVGKSLSDSCSLGSSTIPPMVRSALLSARSDVERPFNGTCAPPPSREMSISSPLDPSSPSRQRAEHGYCFNSEVPDLPSNDRRRQSCGKTSQQPPAPVLVYHKATLGAENGAVEKVEVEKRGCVQSRPNQTDNFSPPAAVQRELAMLRERVAALEERAVNAEAAAAVTCASAPAPAITVARVDPPPALPNAPRHLQRVPRLTSSHKNIQYIPTPAVQVASSGTKALQVARRRQSPPPGSRQVRRTTPAVATVVVTGKSQPGLGYRIAHGHPASPVWPKHQSAE